MSAHEEERLHRLLRASLAPTVDIAASRDLWPDVIAGLNERPAFSRMDKGLLAALVAFGMLLPESLLLVMYSL
jgi:proline dehydrogenase